MQLIGAGALLDHKHVITTAHKVRQFANRDSDNVLLIGLGQSELSEPNPFDKGWIMTKVEAFAIHPEFEPSTLENNVALLRIPGVPCSRESICSVCLNQVMGEVAVNRRDYDTCYETGLGKTKTAGGLDGGFGTEPE